MHASAFQVVIAAAALFCGGAAIGYKFDKPEVPVAGLSISVLGAALLTFTLYNSL